LPLDESLSVHPRRMTNWLVVTLLGVIEGVTEFLPVSSTGHLLIAEHLLKVRESDLFNVVIQAGAVLAVIPLFRRRLGQFVTGWQQPAVRDYGLKLLVAFGLTGAGGVVLEKLHFKLPEEALPVGIALLVGGVLFVLVERLIRGRPGSEEITWAVALAVGIGQLVAAVFPGASRSGTTIILALLLGLSRTAATEFTFLVGIPTMLAASGLKIFKALHHPPAGAVPEDWAGVGVAFVVAALVSFVVVKWLLGYVRSHTFTPFGWYRIAVGAAVLLLLK
jgi:undecaprenyl-diphosphatase